MPSDTFIAKEKGTSYYLRDGQGAGGFLNPPGHAEHSACIIGKRGGHETESLSLSIAAENPYGWDLPKGVRLAAVKALRAAPGEPTAEWIASVYRYFNHSYSSDGTDRNVSNARTYGRFWNNEAEEANEPPKHHLAYLFIRQFVAAHQPAIELMNRPKIAPPFPAIGACPK